MRSVGLLCHLFFFFNDTATTEIYTLSLHDALPISVRVAQRVRPHDAHAVGAHVAQPLAEALETGERPRRDFLIDAAVLGYPGREPHHLAQPIDDGQLAVRVTGDRKSTRLNSSHGYISYAVFCLKKKKKKKYR